MTRLDDHSRDALRITAHRRVSGPIVVAQFRAATADHGVPALTLTDNGLVFTTRFSGGRGRPQRLRGRAAPAGRAAEERQTQSPADPGEGGEVSADPEELALAPSPPSPPTIAQLQALLGAFTTVYNHQRPHRALPHRATPATAYTARPKAAPGDRAGDTHDRVRTDRVDADGKLTLRVNGKLHHIGIGRTLARTPVLMLVRDLHIRVINAATGELLRELILDPARDYQPTGEPPGPKPNDPEPDEGSRSFRCPATGQGWS